MLKNKSTRYLPICKTQTTHCSQLNADWNKTRVEKTLSDALSLFPSTRSEPVMAPREVPSARSHNGGGGDGGVCDKGHTVGKFRPSLSATLTPSNPFQESHAEFPNKGESEFRHRYRTCGSGFQDDAVFWGPFRQLQNFHRTVRMESGRLAVEARVLCSGLFGTFSAAATHSASKH